MKPVTPEPRPGYHAIVFAKDQPQYIPLPANIRYPYVETKWKLSWLDRLRALWRGELYLIIMTFDLPLQPVRLSTKRLERLGGSE